MPMLPSVVYSPVRPSITDERAERSDCWIPLRVVSPLRLALERASGDHAHENRRNAAEEQYQRIAGIVGEAGRGAGRGQDPEGEQPVDHREAGVGLPPRGAGIEPGRAG